MRYSIEALRTFGFMGFLPLTTWRKEATLESTRGEVEGVYVVVRESLDRPEFIEDWHRKPRKKFYSETDAEALWVDGTQTLYFGKAPLRKPRTSGARAGLSQRIYEYWRHGFDQGSSHYGGKLIWQIADYEQLLIAWKPLDTGAADDVESGLLKGFIATEGAPPYANTGRPLKRSVPIFLGI